MGPLLPFAALGGLVAWPIYLAWKRDRPGFAPPDAATPGSSTPIALAPGKLFSVFLFAPAGAAPQLGTTSWTPLGSTLQKAASSGHVPGVTGAFDLWSMLANWAGPASSFFSSNPAVTPPGHITAAVLPAGPTNQGPNQSYHLEKGAQYSVLFLTPVGAPPMLGPTDWQPGAGASPVRLSSHLLAASGQGADAWAMTAAWTGDTGDYYLQNPAVAGPNTVVFVAPALPN
jgi:hypothetical protein